MSRFYRKDKIMGYLKWPKILSNGSVSRASELQFLLPKSSPYYVPGSVYRKQMPPIPMVQLYSRKLTPAILLKDGYTELMFQLGPGRYISNDSRPPIARLKHGLNTALYTPGVHFVKKYGSHISRLYPVSSMDYEAIPPFIPTSKDAQLRRLSERVGAKWRASTSSISSTLIQIYYAISKFRPVNLHMLSMHFQTQSNKFTPSSRAPVSVLLIPENNIYSIDSHKTSEGNEVLTKIGKAYERMVTMDKNGFEACFLSSGSGAAYVAAEEPYNYLNIGNYLLRSQLDCYDSSMGIFDLKSRATRPIRIFPGDDPSMHVGYRLLHLTGPENSYEVEYYDMSRSVFLKYIFQSRIGDMSGIFVAYHNTDEIFGFEYFPLFDMEQAIFQSKSMADFAFESTLKILDVILQRVVQDQPAGVPLRMITNAKIGESKNVTLSVFSHIYGERDTPDGPIDSLFELPSLKGYLINLSVILGDRVTADFLNMCDDHSPTIYYKIERLSDDELLPIFNQNIATCTEPRKRTSSGNKRYSRTKITQI